ncbi:SMP-30/gluconolactonase/LRE family protein [Modicisalibacter xianhensis]|uniref:Sugar lactone lactonase YvrE n=1 Tax=Modicisalibacter xianhensis TaxID=442341 RepID=A0A1I3FHI2_9GAMM|nr:SMP-30/gluconolactonase/LRE family protein [Halomonas xianhensis]TDX24179.1 sugar lactone lactonase YvrE [Halomonas xianhensis]SFI10665.1 Sugar lactone lactonase YvrE [Halomonas xianhensis]
MTETAHCVWSGRAQLGEGPLWSTEHRLLLFVDIRGSRLLAYSPDDGSTRDWPMAEACCWLVPHVQGGFIAGLRSRLVRLQLGPDGPCIVETLARPLTGRSGQRLNDGKADPSGRLWFGTMDDAEREANGSFYRFDRQGLHEADMGYGVPNGPAITADGATLYHTDSPSGTVYAFDVTDGKLANKRVHLRFDADKDGYPDGMTLDTEGGLWVAHWGGGRLSRFLPDGTLDRQVSLPASRVTSCAFGGDDLATLYITTAGVDRDAEPQAGALFAFRPGVTGHAPCSYE